jgi:hypothetical protein
MEKVDQAAVSETLERNIVLKGKRIALALESLPAICRGCPWRSEELGGTGECDAINKRYRLYQKLIDQHIKTAVTYEKLSDESPLPPQDLGFRDFVGSSIRNSTTAGYKLTRLSEELLDSYGADDGPDGIEICAKSLVELTHEDGSQFSMLDVIGVLNDVRTLDREYTEKTGLDLMGMIELTRRSEKRP